MDQKTFIQYGETCPLVSVSIPSYNAANTLAETLDSVLAQTYHPIEIIVVDDGSTDTTQEVLSRYGECVRVIKKTNGGLASARNVGFLSAQGKYIAVLDSDDVCMPERIAIQVAYMEQHPDVVLCSSDFSAFNRSGLIAETYIGKYYSQIADTPGGIAGIYPYQQARNLAGYDVPVYSGNVYEQMVLGSFVHPPTVLFRRSTLHECGLLDESIVNACDFDWLIRMSRVGCFGFIDRPLLKYRFSDNQMSGSRNRIGLALDIVQVIEKALEVDPSLYNLKHQEFRKCLGDGYLDAADALVDEQPLDAIKMMIKSFLFGVFNLRLLKVFVKSFVPIPVLRWIRERR